MKAEYLPHYNHYVDLCVIAGQSYEIRMLDNRKIGELPEITGKMVKVGISCTLAPVRVCKSMNSIYIFPFHSM